ncbi:uncharacterized protein LOC142775522 [Rhipicephalus microplus]|uniref:uncharacterized protein LOC142775522 n=1 Tax=Rhipicephalus microplus TaxID=6941 RepID=UPI003F6C2B8B
MADRFDADSDKAPSIHEGLSPTVVVGLDGALSPEDDAPDDASVNHHGSASSLHLPEPERVHVDRRLDDDLDYNYALWQAESVGVYLMSFLVILSGLALLCLLMMSLRGQKGLSVMLSNMMGGSYVPHKKHAS